MGPLFEILFLEEAFNFLRELDRKHYEKIIYNLRRAQVELNPELFKKSREKFGSSERSTKANTIACWHSGINQNPMLPWLLPHMHL